MTSSNPYAEFIQALLQNTLVTDEIINGQELHNYNQNTFSSKQVIALVIKPIPLSVDANIRYIKILSIIECAKEHKVSLYPISKGKNWGYGSMAPMGDSNVILDLSNFSLIQNFDEVTHQVMVEPGVSQQQLYEFLKENGDKYIMDATGAPVESSIMGNTLECGFGHSTIAERSKNVLNCTFAVPWGENKRTQLLSSGLIGTRDHQHQFNRIMNLGPDASGLALQSNYFVTLTMTIALKLKPEAFCAYFIDLTDKQFPEYIELARELRSLGVVHSASHIGNKHKAIQMALKKYPYKEANNITPLPQFIVDRVSKEYGLADWTVSGAFYGTEERVSADKAVLKKRVAALGAKPMFIDDAKLQSIIGLSSFLKKNTIGKALVRLLSKVSNSLEVQFNKLNMLEDLGALYHLKKGKPTNHFIKTTFWRTRDVVTKEAENLDPNDGKTGFIWIAPCTPISADRVSLLVSIVNRATNSFKFEPAMSITLLNERAAECVISISFDRTNTEEEMRAMKCHQKILEESAKSGYYVYRLSSESSKTNLSSYLEQQHERLDLKQVFDPCNIIASGKYRNIYVSE